jgi:hypothetical protein
MKATVIQVQVPVPILSDTYIYQVDYEEYHVTGYHESETIKGTFGVYNSEFVANIVAQRIMNGSIKPIPTKEE